MPNKPLVALVGRPNVGKSTLFNRLVGERLAIVEDTAGTTRDRHYADAEWNGLTFTLIDTGGIIIRDRGQDEPLDAQVREQAQEAIAEADVIVFMCDIEEGLAPDDYEIAGRLRRTNKPVILTVNKTDNLKREMDIYEFHGLGLGEPLAISAGRGLATGDLLDMIVEALPHQVAEDDEDEGLAVALVGRTNVGKSSLMNRFMGYERVIVSDIPGTTRDAVDTVIRYHDQEITLIDTAGIRKRGSIAAGIERYSVMRSLRAISRADVVFLVIDAVDGVTAQDAHIAGYILEQKRSVCVLVNKWDLVEKDAYTHDQYKKYVLDELKFMSYVPVLFISALTGQRVRSVLDLALRMQNERLQRLTTNQINAIIRNATAKRSPPTKWGKKLRIYYGTQAEVAPPTFVFFVNDRRLVHFGYQRFLENQIRDRYPFEGTPLRVRFRDHRAKE